MQSAMQIKGCPDQQDITDETNVLALNGVVSAAQTCLVSGISVSILVYGELR